MLVWLTLENGICTTAPCKTAPCKTVWGESGVLTLALYGLLAILLAGVLFIAAAYLLPAGEQIAPPIRDEPIWELPAGQRLEHGDIASVRLPVALRGYRFAETDLLLDRLGDELQARDEEIARLHSLAAASPPYESAAAHVGSPSSDEDGETWLAPRSTDPGDAASADDASDDASDDAESGDAESGDAESGDAESDVVEPDVVESGDRAASPSRAASADPDPG